MKPLSFLWVPGLVVLVLSMPKPCSAADATNVRTSLKPTAMVLVHGGCFSMGCGPWARDCDEDESPAHPVCLSEYLLSDHEVTVEEYRAFVSETGYRPDSTKFGGCFRWTGFGWEKDPALSFENPGFPQTGHHPAVCLSLKDAMKYGAWKSGKDNIRYRLPTEAEWEFAARAGGKERLFDWGNGKPSGNVATAETRRGYAAWAWLVWPDIEDGHPFTAPVRSFSPNPIGLYDMSGNVAEWCVDRYHPNAYSEENRDNPTGLPEGLPRPTGPEDLSRVVRGGSWLTPPRFDRTIDRRESMPWGRSTHLGFRLAATPDETR